MEIWTIENLGPLVQGFEKLDISSQSHLLQQMNEKFPPAVFRSHLTKRHKAMKSVTACQNVLNGATQQFPPFTPWHDLPDSPLNLKGYGLVFTAGGEGERLRLSLLARGEDPKALEDFTKATYPLQNFCNNFGALHINLALIASYCKNFNLDIPVIITTGPKGSVTERVIPEVLSKNSNFGLKHVVTIPQDERLHFTMDDRITFTMKNGLPVTVTHPDETGGPLMKLKQKPSPDKPSCIEWLESLGCSKLILAQATAIYDQRLLPVMASAAQKHDCLGVGVMRDTFEPNDPFGTFVTIKKDNNESTCIIEQGVRNETSRKIKDSNNRYFLPFNTGLYALDCDLLQKSDLPDYATPPKEVLPDLPKSPKVGYAATDILPLAKKPLILTVDPKMFAVIKTAEDLSVLAEAARGFGLEEICG